MNKRKGQSAIEYLMNYAWAIALIIIVGVAIYSLDIGGLKTSIQGSGSQLRASGQTMGIIDWVWQDTDTAHAGGVNDTFSFTVQNNGGNKIDFKNATVIEVDNSDVTGASVTTSCSPSSETMFPGDTTSSCTINLHSNETALDKDVEDVYEVRLRIVYNNTETDLLHRPEYTISGTVESG